jgi:hypothetical protein
MKRGFLLTLVTVAIALLCGNVFAYAPIIGNIPEVWIGDEEDNTGPTDLNFFRFTAAFNFDEYVSFDTNDPNKVTTDVRWSFIADATDLLLINGKETITDPYTEAVEPGAKELTDRTDNSPVPRASAEADFWDILDSPATGSPPYPDPVPGSELDTLITIFASNGSKYSCKDVFVRANVVSGEVDMPDKLSENIIVDRDYDSPATQGWAKSSAELPTDGNVWTTLAGNPIYCGTHGTSGGAISGGPGAGHSTNWFYCIWQAPDDEVAYVPGYVYRMKYTLRSSQTDVTKTPNTRLLTQFVGSGILAYSGGLRLGKGLFAPGPVARTYNAYAEPPINLADGGVTNVKPRFEVICFDNNEIGATNYMDQCVVERFPIPSKASGTLVQAYNPTAGWTGWTILTISGSGFAPVTVSSNTTGLYIETPAAVTPGAAINYGKWNRLGDGSPVAFTADKLYRCVYTLQSSVSTIGQIRCLNSNKGTDWIGKLVVHPDQTQVHMPDADGNDYSTWFDTMPEFYTSDPTKNNMSFECDVADGSTAQVGRMYITSVELYYYNIP